MFFFFAVLMITLICFVFYKAFLFSPSAEVLMALRVQSLVSLALLRFGGD